MIMRANLTRLAAGLAAVTLAACSDAGTSPVESTRNVVSGDRPSLDYNGPQRFAGYRSTSFTLTAAGGQFNIGGLYTLTVPSNAVCVLSSEYGEGTWDLPCKTLGNGESIRITATYGFSSTGPVVDFSPDLRFAPDKEVTLSTDLFAPTLTAFRGFFQSNAWATRYFGIYYSPDLGRTLRADAATDASLRTHIDLKTGRVWRRVKHFSGYSQTAGTECEPSPDDPDCIEVPPPIVEE